MESSFDSSARQELAVRAPEAVVVPTSRGEAHVAYRNETAGRVREMLQMSGGHPTDAMCHVVENYRRQTAAFPLPLTQLPCLNCPRRTEGH